MKELETLVEEILFWGKTVSSTTENSLLLEKQLINLYHFYFSVPDASDEKDFPDPPPFPDSYAEILRQNFPQFGYYNVCLNPNGKIAQYENGIGDAFDDVRDILRDLWDVDFYFKQTSSANAIFYFKILFYSHTRNHIRNLLVYLEDN